MLISWGWRPRLHAFAPCGAIQSLSRLNPSIQIRAIPTTKTTVGSSARPTHRSLNPSIQIRAIPTELRDAVPGRPHPVSIPQYRSGQFRLHLPHHWRDDHPVSIPQYRSGQFRPVKIQFYGSGAVFIVSIPQYRSGQFRHLDRGREAQPRVQVSIPQYRSGQFRLRPLQPP